MGLLDSPQVCTLSQKQTETLHYRCIFTHKYPSVVHFHSQLSKCGAFSLTNIQVWCIFTHNYPNVVHFHSQISKCGAFSLTNIQVWCIFTQNYPSVEYFHSQISKCGVFLLTNIHVWCILWSECNRICLAQKTGVCRCIHLLQDRPCFYVEIEIIFGTIVVTFSN